MSTTDKKGYLTFTSSTDTCIDGTFEKVQSGLEILLSHFREPLFPRKVSTATTKNAQKPAQNIADAMKCFHEGSWLDCRIGSIWHRTDKP